MTIKKGAVYLDMEGRTRRVDRVVGNFVLWHDLHAYKAEICITFLPLFEELIRT